IVQRGLALEIEDRFRTAAEMESALHALVRPASGTAIAQWLKGLGKEYMERHEQILAAEEASWRRTVGDSQLGLRRTRDTTRPPRSHRASFPGLPRPDAVFGTPQAPSAQLAPTTQPAPIMQLAPSGQLAPTMQPAPSTPLEAPSTPQVPSAPQASPEAPA